MSRAGAPRTGWPTSATTSAFLSASTPATPPYTRVIVEGTAEIADPAWLGDWKHWAVRYQGEEAGARYYEETKHMPRAYIRITPRKITTWAGPGWHPRYQE